MRLLTHDDSMRWIEQNNPLGANVFYRRGVDRAAAVATAYPSTTYLKTIQLCREVRCAIQEHFDGALLLVREWTMWNNDITETIIDLMRRGMTANAPSFTERPGHLFDRSESDEFFAFLQVVLMAQWDALASPPNEQYCLEISHDEYLLAFSRDETVMNRLLDGDCFVRGNQGNPYAG